LRLLEEDLGVALFDRHGGRLALNASGRILLVAVRDAMRLVHDAVVEVEAPAASDLHVASVGVFTIAALESALVRLGKSHPHVRPHVRTSIGGDPARELLQGALDVFMTDEPLFGDGLTTTLLGETGSSVYCGKEHPLYGRTEVTLEELARHPFVAPAPDPSGLPQDGWPASWPRTVQVEVDRQAIGLAFCLGGTFLALLPHAIGHDNESLWPLPVPVPTVTRIHAVHRTVLGRPGAVGALVDHAIASLRTEAATGLSRSLPLHPGGVAIRP
jgi:DNA-binding transcriptional LysR family regulator